ncbi:hypothetical protein U9M48_035668 [Paspalum notatum var. saurae]|uniref:Uncharacterized protein n=1 Tax=Paspalum notatum var. saurae TaxID=547442 RepID=A0AAQ3UFK6_PASNO
MLRELDADSTQTRLRVESDELAPPSPIRVGLAAPPYKMVHRPHRRNLLLPNPRPKALAPCSAYNFAEQSRKALATASALSLPEADAVRPHESVDRPFRCSAAASEPLVRLAVFPSLSLKPTLAVPGTLQSSELAIPASRLGQPTRHHGL